MNIEIGQLVAVLTSLPGRRKCYVGHVVLASDHGIRIGISGLVPRNPFAERGGEDLFISWPQVLCVAIIPKGTGALERSNQWRHDLEGRSPDDYTKLPSPKSGG